MADKWNGNRSYKVGEEAEHNGVTYVALVPVNNPLSQPYANSNFWAKKGEEEKHAKPEVPVALSPHPQQVPVKPEEVKALAAAEADAHVETKK
jgi:hypothetical protein